MKLQKMEVKVWIALIYFWGIDQYSVQLVNARVEGVSHELLFVPLRQFGLGVVVVQYLFVAIALCTHHGCTYLA